MLYFMTPLQVMVFVGFVAGVAGVFSLAAVLLVRHVHDLVRKAPARRPAFRCFRLAAYSTALFGSACIFYGAFIEPWWIEVTRLRLRSAKIAQPVRLAVLSDIHSEATPRLEPRLPDLVRRERPDVIVFLGDALNDRRGLPIFQECMRRLAEIAPIYAVEGNWDRREWRRLDLFGGLAVRNLRGEAVSLGDTNVWLCGGPWGTPEPLYEAARRVPKDAYRVFMIHTPGSVSVVSRCGADLCLAGHTHGGQVSLPWYGALITLSETGKRFEQGRYQIGALTLYVNRGIGLEGSYAPRVRFGARPEITIVDLEPQAAEGRPSGP
jgi:predicted MPP superfamily phosphohydrolase